MKTIIVAAIRIGNKIYICKRHYEGITKAIKDGVKYVTSNQQGFVTNKGKFVSREKAAKIAFKAGQTSNLKKKLISEDLY